MDILEASEDDVEAWLDSLRLVEGSRYVYISTLNTFYLFAIREKLTRDNPCADIVRPRLPRRQPRPISTDDLAYALRCADPRMKAWLSLAALEGFRCVEMANLRREDIGDTGDPPMVLVNGKGRHQRYVPLHPEALQALRLYGLPLSGHVFRTRERPMLAETISSYIARYMHDLGVPATAHQLRHWFGTHTYAVSKDLRLVQELLGHSSPATTAIYTRVSADDAARTIAALTNLL